MTRAAGVFVDICWAVRRMADTDAFGRIKNLAGTSGAVIGTVNLVGLGEFVAGSA